MPRPKRCRRVCCDPDHRFFKPQGVPVSELEWIDLGLDELEALRLSDLEGLSQSSAAAEMDVSQPTFNRILASARHKTAKALAEGGAIRISSGTKEIALEERGPGDVRGCGCGRRRASRGGQSQ